MMVLAQMFGGAFSYQYKQLGLANGISDHTLSWAGSTAAIVQAVTRLSVGALYDKLGFKKIFNVLMLINIFNSILAYPARTSTWLFFISI